MLHKDGFYFFNNIVFQKPTDHSKKYEDERWEIRFEVSLNPNILETLDIYQCKGFYTKSRSKHFLLYQLQ